MKILNLQVQFFLIKYYNFIHKRQKIKDDNSIFDIFILSSSDLECYKKVFMENSQKKCPFLFDKTKNKLNQDRYE